MIEVFPRFGKGGFTKRRSGIEESDIAVRRGFAVKITDEEGGKIFANSRHYLLHLIT